MKYLQQKKNYVGERKTWKSQKKIKLWNNKWIKWMRKETLERHSIDKNFPKWHENQINAKGWKFNKNDKNYDKVDNLK